MREFKDSKLKINTIYMKNLILIFLLLLSFIACTTTKYIEVPIETIKTEYITNEKVDTFIEKDSIFIKEMGDTIFCSKYKTIYKIKEVRDTILKIDTIPKIQKVETIKEVNKLKDYQVFLMILGGALILFFSYKLIMLIKSWVLK